VLAPGLDVVFCGINPGFHSDAKAAHFANPRNDFWRLLHAAGFTPRLVDPSEQLEVLRYGIGITNAAYRTTRGSSDLRKRDFAGSAERLQRLAVDLRPRALGFVGKEAFRGPFGGRPQHGVQAASLGETRLFVLPSTSPANAAVPWDERLGWFRALRSLVA
jgi:TDG/mug DNA glycosylase family protein